MAQERSVAFVSWILSNRENKGFQAKLRKADSETTAHQTWELLVRWIDLEKPWELLSFSLIGANLSRLKTTSDGHLNLGAGLRELALQNSNITDLENSSVATRLRRLISCRDQEELSGVLKPLLRHMNNKGIALNHAQLLDDILYFNLPNSQEKTKLRWTKEFYSNDKAWEASK